MTRADLIYAARAKRAGAKHTVKTVQEARKAGVPLSWAFALVEQESDFQNVFGGDHGRLPVPTRAPFYHCRVTRGRVRSLLEWTRRGNASNGVGLTQLTSVSLIRLAEEIGGAHVPRNQLHVGFVYFRQVTRGHYSDAWRYNGGRAYQAPIEVKQSKWHNVLTKGTR